MDDRQEDKELKRISLIEQEVKYFSRAFPRLESDVKNINATLERLVISFQSYNKTNWSVLAAWATVILTIVGAIGYLAKAPLENRLDENRYTNIRQYDYLNELRDTAHKNSIGVKVNGQKIYDIEKEVIQIREEQKARTSRVYK